MTKLSLFKRKWDVASDDLFIPFVYGTLSHIVWLLFNVVILLRLQHAIPCNNQSQLLIYISLGILLSFILILIESTIARISIKGTIAFPIPRRSISNWLYAHIVIILIEFANQINGLYLLHFHTPTLDCGNNNDTVLIIKVMTYLSITTMLLYYLLGMLLMLSSQKKGLSQAERVSSWRAWMTCFCFGHHRPISSGHADRQRSLQASIANDTISSVATVLSKVFSETEYSTSDMIVGIYLYSKNQKLSTQTASSFANDNTPLLSFSPPIHPIKGGQATNRPLTGNQDVKAVLLDVKHYFTFAEAIYGLPLYLFTDTCRIFDYICGCGCKKPRYTPNDLRYVQQHIAEPGWPFCCLNMCSTDAAETRHTYENLLLDIQHDNNIKILHLSTENHLGMSPFIVSLDLVKKKIVIAIRGTLSTADVLVDLNCELKSLKDNQTNITFKTHSGILMTANNILQRIEERGLIADVMRDARFEQFGIVCCGHSLGAGVASILAFLLRQTYPQTKCFAYAPPASIVTAEGRWLFEQFATSVVLGDDLVCRLSLTSLLKLRNNVIDTLRHCHSSKLQIYRQGLLSLLPTSLVRQPPQTGSASPRTMNNRPTTSTDGPVAFTDTNDVTIPMYSHSNSSQTPLRLSSDDEEHPHRDSIFLTVRETHETIAVSENDYPNMYLPGRVIHIQRRHNINSTRNGGALPVADEYDLSTGHLPSSGWRVCWRDASEFTEIKLSMFMGVDHLPNRLAMALNSVVS